MYFVAEVFKKGKKKTFLLLVESVVDLLGTRAVHVINLLQNHSL